MAGIAGRHPRTLLFGIVALSAIGLVSCGGTTLRTSWKDPQYHGGPLKKIAVLVIDRDENRRRFAEDLIVQNLPAGTQAEPGYLIFGAIGAQPDKTKIKDRLIADGFNGALVARLAGIIQTQTSQPSQTYTIPQAPFYDPGGMYDPSSPAAALPDYYGYPGGQVTVPGRTTQHTNVVVEVQLYVLPAGNPIWRGITDSMNPDSREALVARIAEIVGQRLRSEGLLAGS
jgi:hypothetical protein